MDYETIFTRKLKSLFPDKKKRNAVKVVLDTYGTEAYEREPLPVRLAILKLSDSDPDEIKRTAEFAKQDYRDILSSAEYPRQSKK
jgi:hypothetical protein